MVICKGTTTRCEAKITKSELLSGFLSEQQLFVTHSKSGWTTETVALEYLQWLHNGYAKGKDFSLLWDVYSTHRSESVEKYAQDNGIALQYIPAGQTGEWQPLDFRIFGSLKARARNNFWQHNVVTTEGNESTIN